MSLHQAELRLSASPREPKPQISSLTGLRFFAALHVLVYHLALHFKADFAALPVWASNIVGSGHLGVPLFFLLSGFVMAVTYLDAAPGVKVVIDARRYWVARLARIYPVYLLSLLLSLPLFLAYKVPGVTGLLSTAKAVANGLMHGMLLQSWYPKIILDWNPPAWSLSVEAFFYGSFPFVVASFGLMTLDRKGLFRSAVALWMLSIALTLGALMVQYANPGMDPKSIGGFRCVLPLLRLPDFLIGIMVGRLFLLRKTTGEGSGLPSLISAGAALAILVAMGLTPETIDHNLISSLMLLPFAILLYGISHQVGLISHLLSKPGMVLLGEASYALYILHWPVLFGVKQGLFLFQGHPIVSSPLFYLPLSGVLTIGLSVLVFRYLEAPLRQRVKRALSATPASPTTPSPVQ